MQQQPIRCIHIQGGRQCNRPAYNRRSHGLLCFSHYGEQQASAPVAPRLPQPRWRSPLSDDDIIADIIATDAAKIAAGTITVIRLGNVDPIKLRVLSA